ncbi:Lrp/AsnC family transcriptional regulator [Pseudomonadota bacterium]
MDEKDLKIMDILQHEAELTSSQISKKTGIPITTVHNRIKKLKNEGIIKHYTVQLDFDKIGKPLKAYVLLNVNQILLSGEKVDQLTIAKKIKMIDGVESVDIITGTTDIIAVVRVGKMSDLNKILTKEFRKIDGVEKTQSLMVLEEV